MLKNTMKKAPFIIRSFFIVTTVLFACSHLAFAEQESGSIFDHFSQQEEGLKVEIEFDIDSMLASKKEEDEIPGTFSYKDAEGNEHTWTIDLQVRGRFRRRICPFPPLKVNFKKKELAEAGYNDHNDLKLVTHCIDNDMGDDNVLREYLVYKMYQIVSDVYYRVQLVKVKYKDSDSGTSFTRYGILLEDEDEMKERYNSKLCEDCFGFPRDSMLMTNVNTHDLFQYMIANPDWSFNMLRNMKLLVPEDGSKAMIVPYDFDFSGVVNATYAVPDPTLGITHVRQRKFMGFATTNEELQPTIEHFKSKQEELDKLIRKFKPLSAFHRRDMMQFVDSFFTCLGEFDVQTISMCGLEKDD